MRGRTAGLLRGRAAGLLRGRAAGLLRGRAAGLLRGRTADLLRGHAAGLVRGHAAGLVLSAAVWLVPPPVLPIPAADGPEGPPRPYGAEPLTGGPSPRTGARLVAAQNRALLDGPFPRGGLTRGISEGTLLLDDGAEDAALATRRIREAGASVVRIPVDWRALVSADPPAGFQPADPASRGYDFTVLDTAVRDAVSSGLQPLLVISHAPAFAEGSPRWPYAYPGSWAPDPAALEAFAAALARRYDGSYPDPQAAGVTLPRVRLLQAWNEPNLPRYLEPQWVVRDGRWSAFSPLLYRGLLNAFYSGVKSVAPSDTVVAAGVAPNGDPPGVGRMQPVTFLSELLCLGGAQARAAAGAARPPARAPHQACPEPPRFDVLAFHPLSVGDPDAPAAGSLDVSISDAAKITRLLIRAERLRTVLPAGPKPLWVTELNWEAVAAGASTGSTAPAPSPSPAGRSQAGVPASLQAAWLSRALHRLWIAGVSLVAWQFLVDPFPGVAAQTPTGGLIEYPRPAGLYGAGPGGQLALARPKPFLAGFELPFDPLRVSRSSVRVWALLAHPGQAGMLEGQTRAGRWRALAALHADGAGVLNVLVRVRGRLKLRLRTGGTTSAVMQVPAGRSRL